MRKPIMVLVPKSGTWPDGAQASGAQVINVPFNWIRVEHRTLDSAAGVLVDFDGFIVNDDTSYWDLVMPGDRRVRNIAGKDVADTWPTRVYFRNLDTVNDAHLFIEIADEPIVDLNSPLTPAPVAVRADASATFANVSVGTGATRLDTGLARRKTVIVTNPAASLGHIRIGFTNAVTNGAATAGGTQGIDLPPGNSWSRSYGPGIQLFAAADTAATIVQVEEAA